MLREVAEGRGWLGCLTARGKQQRFDLRAVRRYPPISGTDNTVRLSDLLSNSNPSCTNIIYHLDWFDRRYLGLCLASTILQLYDTPWLHLSWSGNDVYFVRERGQQRVPLIKQPFVSRAFASQRKLGTSYKPVSHCTCPLIRNKTVFDLGVLLIELCFRKSFKSLQAPEDEVKGMPAVFTDFITATRMIERVRNKAGASWGDAVRRCIYCEFDQSNTSLENENFRQAVYQGVVKPLENDLRHYCGGELPDEN